MAQFNEQDHPRDESGQFTSKGSSASSGKSEVKETIHSKPIKRNYENVMKGIESHFGKDESTSNSIIEENKDYYVRTPQDQKVWDKLTPKEKWLLALAHRNDSNEDILQEIDMLLDADEQEYMGKVIEEIQSRFPSYQENEKKNA